MLHRDRGSRLQFLWPLKSSSGSGRQQSALQGAGSERAGTDTEPALRRGVLFEAVRQQRFRQTSLLLEAGVDVNEADETGTTALLYCCRLQEMPRHSQVKFARLLLDYGADPNTQDARGMTALMHATCLGLKEMVVLLLSHGRTDLCLEDSEGNTALMYSAQAGRKEITGAILNALDFQPHYAKIQELERRNKQGRTALQLALRGRHEVCARLLIKESRQFPCATLDFPDPAHLDRGPTPGFLLEESDSESGYWGSKSELPPFDKVKEQAWPETEGEEQEETNQEQQRLMEERVCQIRYGRESRKSTASSSRRGSPFKCKPRGQLMEEVRNRLQSELFLEEIHPGPAWSRPPATTADCKAPDESQEDQGSALRGSKTATINHRSRKSTSQPPPDSEQSPPRSLSPEVNVLVLQGSESTKKRKDSGTIDRYKDSVLWHKSLRRFQPRYESLPLLPILQNKSSRRRSWLDESDSKVWDLEVGGQQAGPGNSVSFGPLAVSAMLML